MLQFFEYVHKMQYSLETASRMSFIVQNDFPKSIVPHYSIIVVDLQDEPRRTPAFWNEKLGRGSDITLYASPGIPLSLSSREPAERVACPVTCDIPDCASWEFLEKNKYSNYRAI